MKRKVFILSIFFVIVFTGCLQETEYNFGYIDKTGNFVIEPQFDNALPFNEDMAAVMLGNSQLALWGYIDLTGERVIDYQYEKVRGFYEGLSPVMK